MVTQDFREWVTQECLELQDTPVTQERLELVAIQDTQDTQVTPGYRESLVTQDHSVAIVIVGNSIPQRRLLPVQAICRLMLQLLAVQQPCTLTTQTTIRILVSNG